MADEPIFTHTLREQIPNAEGDMVSEIGFRKPRAGDMTRCGNPVKYMPHDEKQEITFNDVSMNKMLSALSGIPAAMIDRMDTNDVLDCSWGIARFFIPGLSRTS